MELDRWAEAEFDLAVAPLWRVHLSRLGPEDHVLAVAIHHLVADAWSIDVLQHDLAALYTMEVTGAGALPAIDLSVGEIHALEDRHEHGAARAYWRRQLTPRPRALPLSFGTGLRSDRSVGRTHTHRVDTLLADELRDYVQARGTTLFIALTTAVRVLLYRYTGETDLALVAPIAGRDDARLESQAGLFINLLPLRNDLDPVLGFDDVLSGENRTALDAYQHRRCPFDEIVEDLGGGDVFDVVVTLQSSVTAESPLPDLTVSTFDLRPTFAGYALAFEFAEHAGNLLLLLTYDAALFTPPGRAAGGAF